MPCTVSVGLSSAPNVSAAAPLDSAEALFGRSEPPLACRAGPTPAGGAAPAQESPRPAPENGTAPSPDCAVVSPGEGGEDRKALINAVGAMPPQHQVVSSEGGSVLALSESHILLVALCFCFVFVFVCRDILNHQRLVLDATS